MKKAKPNILKSEQNSQPENSIEMSTFRYARENGSKPAYEPVIIKKTQKKSKNVQFEHDEKQDEKKSFASVAKKKSLQ
jgi:hypothetical protein